MHLLEATSLHHVYLGNLLPMYFMLRRITIKAPPMTNSLQWKYGVHSGPKRSCSCSWMGSCLGKVTFLASLGLPVLEGMVY